MSHREQIIIQKILSEIDVGIDMIVVEWQT